MAVKNTCDLCENDATDTIEVKSSTTTTIKLDVCIEHLAEYKRVMRLFTGQEFEEVKEIV